MATSSMPCDQDIAEIALAWVYLPTGAAVLQGIVRHPDGGPIIGGAAVAHRPLAAGGAEVVFAGSDPDSPQTAAHCDNGGATGTDPLQEWLVMRGWRPITRVEAAAILRLLGYRLRPSAAPGHVIHADQGDEEIWHHNPILNGRAFRDTLAAFAVRPKLAPAATPATPAATGWSRQGSIWD